MGLGGGPRHGMDSEFFGNSTRLRLSALPCASLGVVAGSGGRFRGTGASRACGQGNACGAAGAGLGIFRGIDAQQRLLALSCFAFGTSLRCLSALSCRRLGGWCGEDARRGGAGQWARHWAGTGVRGLCLESANHWREPRVCRFASAVKTGGQPTERIPRGSPVGSEIGIATEVGLDFVLFVSVDWRVPCLGDPV